VSAVVSEVVSEVVCEAMSPVMDADRLSRRVMAAWAVLDTVPDPEVPALSLRDLGVVREVTPRAARDGGGLEVVLTPTYSGCPATEVIAESVKSALESQGLGPVAVKHRLAPAWTTDWISESGRRKLREYGVAPPEHLSEANAGRPQPIRLRPRNVACPRCGSLSTERLSAFGSTACKALHRCLVCREPFEHFKPI
jgi:ring-1,2-phenylacetyl-CoA epoxidase subunit PaaD